MSFPRTLTICVSENERKIKAICLMRFSGLNLRTMSSMRYDSSAEIGETVRMLLQHLQSLNGENWPTPTESDGNLIYLIAGSVIRSEVRHNNNCDECEETLVLGEHNGDPVSFETPDGSIFNANDLVEELSRGGLLEATPIGFHICLRTWQVFHIIVDNERLKNAFLSCTSQRKLVVDTVFSVLELDQKYFDIAGAKLSCNSGHDFVKSLVNRFSSVLCKCFVRNLSDEVAFGAEISDRKAKKLTGRRK